jgi:integrase
VDEWLPAKGNLVMSSARKKMVQWTDENGKRHTVTARTKEDAKALRASMHSRVFRAKHGIISHDEAVYAKSSVKPLLEHLSDWKDSMLSRGDTFEHAARYRRVLSEILIEGCGTTRLAELDCLRVERWIADQHPSRWTSATCNHAVRAARSFGRWLELFDRWPKNPFKRLKKLRVTDEEPQGAFEPAEVIAFIQAAECGPVRFGIPGRDRAMLYRVAVGTGFRAGSLRKLKQESFVLDSTRPYVVLRAADNKARKRKEQPIQPELAAILKPYLVGKKPGELALRMPHPCSVVRMFRRDLAAAKVPEKNAAGESRKFHGLRHTFITICDRTAGLSVAQALAGHSTPMMTRHYSHSSWADNQRGLANLPIVPVSAALALQSRVELSPEQSQSVQPNALAGVESKADSSGDFRQNQAISEMGRAGIEPATHGFSVHCSTN